MNKHRNLSQSKLLIKAVLSPTKYKNTAEENLICPVIKSPRKFHPFLKNFKDKKAQKEK